MTWKNGASWLWAGLCLLILVGAFFGWQTVGHVCRDAVGRTPACARGGAAPGAGAAAALAGAAGGAGAGAPKVDAAPAAGGDDEAAWAAAFPAPDNLDDAALAVPCELVTCAACATACPCCRPSSGAGAGVGAAGGAA